MKKLFCLIICVLAFSISTSAQALEAFDVATFKSPKGWTKQVSKDSIQFSTADKENYCLVTLFKSVSGLGNAKEDFDAAWDAIVKSAVNISTPPQMFPADNIEEWQLLAGFAPFEKDGAKGVAVLYTASGYGKMVNALVLTNTQVYEPAITAFFGSIRLKKLEARAKLQTENNIIDSSIVGQWGTNVVVRSTSATSYSGTAGSTVKQYTFNADGTYSFASKTFSFSYEKLILIKESGSYQVNGSNVTLAPQKSVTQAWSKKDNTDQWGKLLTTQNRPLEKVTYRFTKNYSNGMSEWRLVLQADNVTQRDGPFNGGSAFKNAWIYSPPCEKCLIELPR